MWFRRLVNWIKNLFNSVPPSVPEPSEPIAIPEPVEPPVVEPEPPKEPDYSFTPKQYRQHYLNLWNTMVIREDKESTIQWYLRKIEYGKARYRAVEAISGIPWQLIAVIHGLEGSFDFEGVLHNGDRIIGTGRKTYRVPKGRGPFNTWEEAAIDAVKIKHTPSEWNIVNTLHYLERYNGLGYLRDSSKPNSPYLWSFSKHYFRGKYVQDGVYSASAVSSQCGAAILLKRLGFDFE